jgi:hypothetical protein
MKFVNSLVLSIYMIIAFISIGFSEKLKIKSSIGSEMQNFYLDKHINYIYASVVVWTCFLSSSYFTLYQHSLLYNSNI